MQNPDPPDSQWKRTPVSNLVRYEPSGIYFARLRVGGKLIRQSLKTDVFSVAQLRLGDLIKAEREKLEVRATSANGKMTFGDAMETYRQQLEANPSLKPMDRAAKAVGFARITHHDLRHLFATGCIESGVAIPTVSRWPGHKTPAFSPSATRKDLRWANLRLYTRLLRFTFMRDEPE